MTNPTNILGTQDVLWDLKDLYDNPKDKKIESDIYRCEKEAAALNLK